MPATTSTYPWASPKHRNTVHWVVAIAAIALIFDGYDLVVYGTVLPILMDDPSHLGQISAAQAGLLGSYALVGVMVGALVTGALGDHLGRRKMMLVNIAWFSIGMGAAAMSTNITMFGLLRFFTGIGVGGLVATAGAVVAEFAPPGKRNLYNAIVYSGVPAGGVLASILAIGLRDLIGWRGLFWVGALPIVFLLPLAIAKLPESPKWLVARGKVEQAQRVCDRFGVPVPHPEAAPQEIVTKQKVGFAALVTRRYLVGTALLGVMSFAGLLLTYGLNTWLPKIMQDAGFNAKGSLSFLLVLNGGAIVGGLIASRFADISGPKRVIVTTFVLASFALVLLTFGFSLPVLLAAVAVAGTGTIGTQVLIYGMVSNYYDSAARGAGVAWCAGFGRLGGIFGPLIGGLLIGAGLSNDISFYIFAGIALLGALVTATVPRSQHHDTEVTVVASGNTEDTGNTATDRPTTLKG
ncbi:MAG TPA: aromatic acid/H+ symport family MFS transporter [Aldersonia sp.]